MRRWATRLRPYVHASFTSIDDALSPTPCPPKPRRLVEPEKLKEEIALNLGLIRNANALKQQAVGQAFKIVASLIVDDMVQRGYEVTAPPPNEMHGSWLRRDRPIP